MQATKSARATKAAATRAANKAAKAAQAAIDAAGIVAIEPLTSTAPAIVPAPVADAPADAPAADAAEKPRRTHYHREHGVSAAHYSGLSSYFNSNRKTAIPFGNTKYAVSIAQLTARGLGLHTALRNAYGTATFPARGLDNAILARLLHAGLIERHSGGHNGSDDGIAYVYDGAEPLRLALTETGQSFGAK